MQKLVIITILLALGVVSGCKENKEKSSRATAELASESKPVGLPAEEASEPELVGIAEPINSEIVTDIEKKTRRQIFKNDAGRPMRVVIENFDDLGRVVKCTEKDARGKVTMAYTLTYDADGNEVKKEIVDGPYKGVVYTYIIIAKDAYNHWTEREEYVKGELKGREVRELEYTDGDSIPIVSSVKRL